jgi:endonuclease YncB( thermonuclease family)
MPRPAAVIAVAIVAVLYVHQIMIGERPMPSVSLLDGILTSKAATFQICYFPGETHCVIDGDTIDYMGQRIRMVDYDTPEIGEPKCASEEALGHKAKHRLIEILNSGPVAVTPHGDRDIDKYGRKLRLVTVNGRSVGDTLISEGLAVPWEGHRHFLVRVRNELRQ